MTLETSIEFLKNIGTERAKFIRNVLGISTVEDLLTFYPIRYIDKSKIYKTTSFQTDLKNAYFTIYVNKIAIIFPNKHRACCLITVVTLA